MTVARPMEKLPPEVLDRLLAEAAWAKRLCRALMSPADANDAWQDAMVTAIQHPPEPRSSVRPWLRVVLTRQHANRRRSEQRRLAREQAPQPEGPPPSDASIAERQLARTVAEAVTELPEPYRSTVVLRHWEDLSTTEIAERQRVPAGTVRGRLATAHAELREMLTKRLRAHGLRALVRWANDQLAPPNTHGPTPPTPATTATPFLGATAAIASLVAVVTVASQRGSSRDVPVATREAHDALLTVPAEIAMAVPSPPPRFSPPPIEPPSKPPAARSTAAVTSPASTLAPVPTGQRTERVFDFGSSGSRCTIATDPTTEVGKACSAGGLKEAKKAMKALTKAAKKAGWRGDCDSCHKDTESKFELTDNARDEYSRMRAAALRTPASP